MWEDEGLEEINNFVGLDKRNTSRKESFQYPRGSKSHSEEVWIVVRRSVKFSFEFEKSLRFTRKQ
jgi:hypothetical protein